MKGQPLIFQKNQGLFLIPFSLMITENTPRRENMRIMILVHREACCCEDCE